MPALEQHTVTDRAHSHVTTASSMHQEAEHFAKQFNEDLAKNTDAAKTAKAVLTHLFGNDVQAQRDEAFAVMFAHSFCPSTTEYAKNMLEAFGGYYKLVDEFRRANKL